MKFLVPINLLYLGILMIRQSQLYIFHISLQLVHLHKETIFLPLFGSVFVL